MGAATAGAGDTKAKPKASLAARLWQYQEERFPLMRHGPLIAAGRERHAAR